MENNSISFDMGNIEGDSFFDSLSGGGGGGEEVGIENDLQQSQEEQNNSQPTQSQLPQNELHFENTSSESVDLNPTTNLIQQQDYLETTSDTIAEEKSPQEFSPTTIDENRNTSSPIVATDVLEGTPSDDNIDNNNITSEKIETPETLSSTTETENSSMIDLTNNTNTTGSGIDSEEFSPTSSTSSSSNDADDKIVYATPVATLPSAFETTPTIMTGTSNSDTFFTPPESITTTSELIKPEEEVQEEVKPHMEDSSNPEINNNNNSEIDKTSPQRLWTTNTEPDIEFTNMMNSSNHMINTVPISQVSVPSIPCTNTSDLFANINNNTPSIFAPISLGSQSFENTGITSNQSSGTSQTTKISPTITISNNTSSLFGGSSNDSQDDPFNTFTQVNTSVPSGTINNNNNNNNPNKPVTGSFGASNIQQFKSPTTPTASNIINNNPSTLFGNVTQASPFNSNPFGHSQVSQQNNISNLFGDFGGSSDEPSFFDTLENQRLEKERLERERVEREERERVERQRWIEEQERIRIEQERLNHERRLEQERLDRERKEKERIEYEKKLEDERVKRELYLKQQQAQQLQQQQLQQQQQYQYQYQQNYMNNMMPPPSPSHMFMTSQSSVPSSNNLTPPTVPTLPQSHSFNNLYQSPSMNISPPSSIPHSNSFPNLYQAPPMMTTPPTTNTSTYQAPPMMTTIQPTNIPPSNTSRNLYQAPPMMIPTSNSSGGISAQYNNDYSNSPSSSITNQYQSSPSSVPRANVPLNPTNTYLIGSNSSVTSSSSNYNPPIMMMNNIPMNSTNSFDKNQFGQGPPPPPSSFSSSSSVSSTGSNSIEKKQQINNLNQGPPLPLASSQHQQHHHQRTDSGGDQFTKLLNNQVKLQDSSKPPMMSTLPTHLGHNQVVPNQLTSPGIPMVSQSNPPLNTSSSNINNSGSYPKNTMENSTDQPPIYSHGNNSPYKPPSVSANSLHYPPPPNYAGQMPMMSQYQPLQVSPTPSYYNASMGFNEYQTPSNSQWNSQPSKPNPLLYSRAHPVVAFGFGGKLMVIKSNSSAVDPTLPKNNMKLHQIKNLIGNNNLSFQQLSTFPGPLTSSTSKDNVNKWIQERINEIQSRINLCKDSEASTLLWELLKHLCNNYGQFNTGASNPNNSAGGNSSSNPPNEQFNELINILGVEKNSNQTLFPSDSNRSDSENSFILNEIQRLVIQGNIVAAHKIAIDNQIWHHALILSQQISPDAYFKTLHSFTNSTLPVGSPLKTLYSMYSNNVRDLFKEVNQLPQPVLNQSSTMTSSVFLDKWKENISTILFNGKASGGKLIGEIGDCIWAVQKRVEAAHVCYLLADHQFGNYGNQASRIVLLGGDHKFSKNYITIESLQRSEIYEYSKILGNSQYSLPILFVYKFIYATTLADYGLIDQSIKYINHIKNLLKNHQVPNPIFHYHLDTFNERITSFNSNNKLSASGSWIPSIFTKGIKGILGKQSSSSSLTPSPSVITSPPSVSSKPAISMPPIQENIINKPTTPVKSNSFSIDQDDDLGFSNSKTPKSSSTATTNTSSPSTTTGDDDKANLTTEENDEQPKSWFKSMFVRKTKPKQMILDNTGDMYYDKELGWVERGKEAQALAEANDAPPPPSNFNNSIPSHPSTPPMTINPNSSTPPMAMMNNNSPTPQLTPPSMPNPSNNAPTVLSGSTGALPLTSSQFPPSTTDGSNSPSMVLPPSTMNKYSMSSPSTSTSGRRKPRYVDTFNQTIYTGQSPSVQKDQQPPTLSNSFTSFVPTFDPNSYQPPEPQNNTPPQTNFDTPPPSLPSNRVDHDDDLPPPPVQFIPFTPPPN